VIKKEKYMQNNQENLLEKNERFKLRLEARLKMLL